MLKLFMAALYLLIIGGASLAQEATPAAKPTPADGHTIHVTAPHLIDGKVRGPFHHYCKVVAPDPFIQCLLFETNDPNAKLVGIEYIVAKPLTRNREVVPASIWTKLWNDHAEEMAT